MHAIFMHALLKSWGKCQGDIGSGHHSAEPLPLASPAFQIPHPPQAVIQLIFSLCQTLSHCSKRCHHTYDHTRYLAPLVSMHQWQVIFMHLRHRAHRIPQTLSLSQCCITTSLHTYIIIDVSSPTCLILISNIFYHSAHWIWVSNCHHTLEFSSRMDHWVEHETGNSPRV
ncbi:hypothetical protein PAXRUDRAFT_509226 [Paxillus rubicundulus Ve08.2h10]|uniref:Uncharacterized protein n=1 Tax=Paxillus rubicundulus Ve08.2h10 TaxID=930991 RepID=A0A0D0DCK5_9AGAM|nr:hypothetical protein PAXRUDRAFT_509226 [Paxillus rubicundulus Ve08.2h10]